MSLEHSAFLGQLGVAVRTLVLLTVVLGLAYPLAMTGIAQVGFADEADGSLIESRRPHRRLVADRPGLHTPVEEDGEPVLDQDGNLSTNRIPPTSRAGRLPPAPATTHWPLRPPTLLRTARSCCALVEERRAAAAKLDGVDPSTVPPDALTASGSGLDPHISPAYAEEQVARVARERGLEPARGSASSSTSTPTGRMLGFLGEPAVNVLELNLALDALDK